MQYNFQKMRGGVEGRLEFFQKIIRFGSGILPIGIGYFFYQQLRGYMSIENMHSLEYFSSEYIYIREALKKIVF